jgi:hypothetical protein
MIMRFRTGFIFTAAGVATLLTPAIVMAACSQADISGQWQATASGYGGGRFYRAECTVSVGTNGAISGSSCTNTQGQTGAMTDARLILSSGTDCSYRGSFIWFNTLHQVNQLTLAGGRKAADGTGTFERGHFTFVMTKTGQ